MAVSIPATCFFRDPEVWDMLKRLEMDPVRVWVAGCATGEEALSLAIVFDEKGKRGTRILATDISGKFIETARKGEYSDCLVRARVSKRRLKRYFIKTAEGKMKVIPEIGDRVIFEQHDIITGSPLSSVDFLMCRNVLMYFNPAEQTRIIRTFFESLKPGGIMLLESQIYYRRDTMTYLK